MGITESTRRLALALFCIFHFSFFIAAPSLFKSTHPRGIQTRDAFRFLGKVRNHHNEPKMKYQLAILFAAIFCFGGMTTANAAAPGRDLCHWHRHHHWHHWHHHHHHRW